MSFIQDVVDIYLDMERTTQVINRCVHDAEGRQFEAIRIGGITFLIGVIPSAEAKA